VIRSEWIKLRSPRSAWFSLLAAVVIIVGLGTLFAWLHANGEEGDGKATEITIDTTQSACVVCSSPS
jgi:hypothetical protein